MSKLLLIGGTDPSGAGLQTDWQVVHFLQLQAHSIVTAVTAQNSQGVFDQGELSYLHVKTQLDSLQGVRFSAIKIGMLGNEVVIKAVVEFLQTQSVETLVILDPVLSSSSGGALITQQGVEGLLSSLLPLVTLITPNADELGVLTQTVIDSYEAMESSAKKLLALGVNVALVKGGHFSSDNEQTNRYSVDLLMSSSEKIYLKGKRWDDRNNVRGTGCALATAIACLHCKKHSLSDAVVVSKALISGAIRQATLVGSSHQLRFLTPAKHMLFEKTDLAKVYKKHSELSHDYSFTRCDTHHLGIYPVVDSVDWLKKLIPLGVSTLQLRMKDRENSEVEGDIVNAIQYGKQHRARLFINDYWQLSIKHNAYGIHLGQEDLDQLTRHDLEKIAASGCRLGVSTHNYTEVARAHAINPSYLALGPVFETTSKVMPWTPQGISMVKNWVTFFEDEYPLVAIGGINLERAKALFETGVGSVAMISAITAADDYVLATEDFMAVFD